MRPPSAAMRSVLLGGAAFAALAASAPAARPEDPIALGCEFSVRAVSGPVTLDGQPVAPRALVRLGHTVETGAHATVTLATSGEGYQVTLPSHSAVRVLTFNPSHFCGSVRTRLLHGAAVYDINGLRLRANAYFTTPNADGLVPMYSQHSIKHRERFSVRYRRARHGRPRSTRLTVSRGRVSFFRPSGRGRVVRVGAKQTSRLVGHRPPTRPRRVR